MNKLRSVVRVRIKDRERKREHTHKRRLNKPHEEKSRQRTVVSFEDEALKENRVGSF